jgi:hypothetical protein
VKGRHELGCGIGDEKGRREAEKGGGGREGRREVGREGGREGGREVDAYLDVAIAGTRCRSLMNPDVHGLIEREGQLVRRENSKKHM